MKLTVDVDSEEVQRAFRKAPDKVNKHIQDWVDTVAAWSESTAKKEVSEKVDTGQLQNSITKDINRLSAVVHPTAKHAIYVHSGRKPGKWPPFHKGSALERWSNRKGIEPFLVARAIKTKGIKKFPFMDRTYRKVKPRANRLASQTLRKIVEEI